MRLFCGCAIWYDGSLNLYYAENWFYDPETGSVLSSDPAKSGLNWYQYCGSNPTTYVDPLGLFVTVGKEDNPFFFAKMQDSENHGRSNGDISAKSVILNLMEAKNGVSLVEEYLGILRTLYPDYNTFLEIMAFYESTYSYTAKRGQYLGRYQIGDKTFQQIGFKDENGN